MVASASGMLNATTILLKRSSFTAEEADRLLARVEKVPHNVVRYAPGKPFADGLVTRIITRPRTELHDIISSYRYDVTPVFDDSPFFWHFARLRDVVGGARDRTRIDLEDSLGERVLLFLLGLGVTYAAAFLLLPFFAIRATWREFPHKALTGAYFAAIGLGYMFFEVVLIQKLTLLLGYPTYSLSVTLAAMLAFTGIGSLLTARYLSRYRSALAVLVAVIVAATLFYQFAMDPLVSAALPRSEALRVVLAIVMLLPLGLSLGGFMPVGLAVAASHTRHREEYVAWGWAVNGFFSVIASILATILSMTLGFATVMYVALALYLIAAAVLLAIGRTGAGQTV
jgi:hypothetical protein